MEYKTESGPRRGVFLRIMLASYAFLLLQRLLGLLFPSLLAKLYIGGPSWGYNVNLLAFGLQLAGFVGILTWKKWGLYLIAGTELAEMLLSVLYFASQIPIESRLAIDLGYLVLLVWAVQRRWKFFR